MRIPRCQNTRPHGGAWRQAAGTLRSNVRLDGGFNPDSWAQDTANFTTEIRAGRGGNGGDGSHGGTGGGGRASNTPRRGGNGGDGAFGVLASGAGGQSGNGGEDGSGGPSIGIAFATGSSASGSNTITLGQGGAGGFRSAPSTRGPDGRAAQTLEVPVS